MLASFSIVKKKKLVAKWIPGVYLKYKVIC